MKQILILGIVLMLTFSSVLASSPTDGTADSAAVSFTLPAKIVYDVPFSIGVNINVNDGQTSFTEFDLSFTSDTGQVIFNSHSPNYFDVHASTGAYSGNTGYRYYTTAAGQPLTSNGAAALFTLAAKAKGTIAPSVIKLDPVGQNTMTSSIGNDVLTVSVTESGTISPSLSACGDGVVGYIDSDENGVRDYVDTNNNGVNDYGDKEQNEACDTALAADGCSDDCTYIKASHKIEDTVSLALQQQCSFGARSCPLEQLTGLPKFLAKVNAIFAANFPSCFPYSTHPQAQAGFTGEKNGAFCVAAKGIVYQITPLRNALLDYYAEP